ncbi:MAG: DUF1365 domain-containing protein [Cellvibrionaceae bacterium]
MKTESASDNQSSMFKSAIYKGTLKHERIEPKRHAFEYSVFMMYLDLDEVEEVFSRAFEWSFRRPAIAWMKRSDFLGDHSDPIKKSVIDKIKKETGEEFSGSVRVLTNLRYFGFIMNPLVCYYCFNKMEQLEYIVAEVTNTPWKEKHCYVLTCNPDVSLQRISFEKKMHVSPFNTMEMTYKWQSNKPSQQLSIRLMNWFDAKRLFEANLVLERETISAKSLHHLMFFYPWMTLKVCGAIYWQALKLYFKGIQFVPHPKSR